MYQILRAITQTTTELMLTQNMLLSSPVSPTTIFRTEFHFDFIPTSYWTNLISDPCSSRSLQIAYETDVCVAQSEKGLAVVVRKTPILQHLWKSPPRTSLRAYYVLSIIPHRTSVCSFTHPCV